LEQVEQEGSRRQTEVMEQIQYFQQLQQQEEVVELVVEL
jgi:hypothetical protein